MNNANDFVINNGVLTKYTGNDENIVIPDGVTSIGFRAFEGCRQVTIHAPAGSFAKTYAKENNIPFVAE